MNLLLWIGIARAVDAAPPVASPPAPPAVVAPVDAPVAEPPPEPPPSGEEVIIYEETEVARRRGEVYQALRAEGYRKGRDLGDRTVFLPRSAWKPQVVVYDDGWVALRRSPPRIHAPGRSFADQGRPTEYLLCIIMPTSCISIGGWLVSKRKLDPIKEEVLDATREEVRALNDAVARRELVHRLNEDIPGDLEAIWAREELSPADRHLLLYTYWDTRTETPEGMEARAAIRGFLVGVVQGSATPITAAELARLNAGRESEAPLVLPVPEETDP